MKLLYLFLIALVLSFPATAQEEFDVVIRGGMIYDGSGGRPFKGDVGMRGDRIVQVGNLRGRRAASVVDATGMAVAPGFINMLSWSTESLILDPRSLGELKQGVTTQIFGEGWTMGPLNDQMKQRIRANQGNQKFDVEWTTLGEYLRHLQKRGVSQNVASFVGATSIRIHVLGESDVQPTPEQLQQMRQLVRQEMADGALGIGSSLIYAPAFYARTEELIELCREAAKFRGKYISHMRSEGNRLVEAVEELIRIGREANLPAEIYHLKAAGTENWGKMDTVIKMVEDARNSGLKITANMYTYTAGATGLDASLPPWALDGGYPELFKRIKDPATRKRLLEEMRTPTDKWENLRLAAGSPDRMILVGFRNEKLRPLTGKTLAEVSKMRGTDPENTILDLIVEDQSRVGTVYFLMSEENVRKQIKLPWVSFGSDAASVAPEGDFLNSNPHPRAYGTFARLLGKYVREEKVIPLEEAIRRLTGLPATNLELDRRGFLRPDHFADLVIFDPKTVGDRATFDKPHQFSTGVRDVFVNGVQVLRAGEHTGRFSGRALYGPGKVN
jgi:N-acyl-D-amino-acid deacylase